MVPGREDMEHDPGGEGGEVPDGLHHGNVSPSLLKCVRTGPQAQLRPLYDTGLPPQLLPEGALQVPRGLQSAPPQTTNHPNKGGQNLHGPTEGRTEAEGMGRKEIRLDLGRHVENRQRESLRAPRSCKESATHSEVRPRDRGKPEGQQAKPGRGSRSRGGGATWFGPTITPGSLAPDNGVELSCI